MKALAITGTSENPEHASGFTLIELLTTLLILSLLGLMSYRGLAAVLDTRDHVVRETEKWRSVATFFSRFESDIRLAAPRQIRVDTGGSIGYETVPAWRGVADGTEGPALEFSRFATAEGVDTARRLAYRLNDNKEIELWLWPALDIAPGTTATRYPVLSGVAKITFRYLSSNLVWVAAWPMPGFDSAIPRAVQVGIVLTSGEEIMRIFSLGS